ncbi:MAG TPA: PEP-CTERM sorting domain-containing protein [Gemmataceae bacterium]|nr:PEP-CTERM sorting domain-containing protein [Gemmataceae bacterium]
MKHFIGALAATTLLAAAGRSAAGVIDVNFDNLSGQAQVPNGYGGVNWSGHWDYYGFSQPPFNPQSGPNRIYTDYGSPVASGPGENTFTFPNPAVFLGAYFSGYSFADLKFNLYYQNALVFTSADLKPSAAPTFLASGYSGLVDKVGVWSQTNDYYVMDDVTYEPALRAGAPEPASLALVGVGALGMAGWVWRRRRRTTA